MRVLFVFLDGVGIGPPSLHNPLSTQRWDGLEELAHNHPWVAPLPIVRSERHVVTSIDACLGVDGLPQSGTGQATLFTGVNCAAHVGRHFGPYPHSSTHDILQEQNVFRRIESQISPVDPRNHASSFANAYPPQFFEWVNGRGRLTVTTRSAVASGLTLRRSEDLVDGNAISADITATGWPDPDSPVQPRTEAEAARDLLHLHRQHRFTLFEYYLTDKVGHGRLDVSPKDILASVNRFLRGLVDGMDPEKECLVVASDHGNIEDTSTKTHTRNPVPLIAWGEGAHMFEDVANLGGVTPAIEKLLCEHHTRQHGASSR